MDADRFDTIARALHSSPTRRLTLGALTALGLAAVLGDAETDAKQGGGKKGGGKGGGKKGGGKKGDGKKKKKKTNPPPPPPVGIAECESFNLSSGCRNVTGKPHCCNFTCQPCCVDADCQHTPLKFCSIAPSGNVCM